MCGIIAYTGQREAVPLLLEGLRKLEYRGYDSAGVAILSSQGSTRRRAEGKIKSLEATIAADPVQGSCGIAHTRWATHGPPVVRNAHPHRAGTIHLVHNGIIENHRELKQELGIDPESETDTEILAHLVAKLYEATKAEDGEGDLAAAVRQAVAKVEGAWGICVTTDDHPELIVGARKASPLLVGLGPRASESDPRRECFMASDVAAMLAHTRLVVDLNDGDVVSLGPEGLRGHWDAEGSEVRRSPRTIDWSPIAAEKQGFKHFMLKEIHEQPRAIRETMMGRLRGEKGACTPDFSGLDFTPDETTRFTIVACGTSWHAALAGKYFIEQLARIPVEVDLASEYRYRKPIVRKGDIALAISQSGETADTLAALSEAGRLGARTWAICNVVDSTIARTAEHTFYTHAGPEISVASTKAFTTQLTMLLMLAIELGRRSGALSEDRVHELCDELRSLPVTLSTALAQQPAVKIIARRYHSARDWLYLGRGLSFPVALEGALKLKEISYAHAEGYAAGEMKHGPIALVDEKVPVVTLALKGPGYHKSLSNLEEVRTRGGKIVAVCTAGDAEIADVADEVILVPPCDPLLQPIVASLPLQLLAYYVADINGTDVDQPRNLAKSVTVE